MSEVAIFKNFISVVEKATNEQVEKQKKAGGVMEFVGSFCEDIRHYENYHSNLLAYLLDPQASHKHGSEYLKLFLEQVGIPAKVIELVGDGNDITVKREFTTDDGRIDILIKKENYFAIVIENKIWACLMEGQLSAYYNGFKSKYQLDNTLFIVYLTLNGEKAGDYKDGYGFEKCKDGNIIDNLDKRVINISYKKDILTWLSQLPTKQNEILIRSALNQYIYTVQKLTGQTEEEISLMSSIEEELLVEMDRLDNKDIDSLKEVNLPKLLEKLILKRIETSLIDKFKKNDIKEYSLVSGEWFGWKDKKTNYYYSACWIPIEGDVLVLFEVETSIEGKDSKINGYNYGLRYDQDKRSDAMTKRLEAIDKESKFFDNWAWYHYTSTDKFDEIKISDEMVKIYIKYSKGLKNNP